MGPAGVGGLNREPNVVPMIDILLVLLIAAILWALPHWRTDVQLPVPVEGPTTSTGSVPLVLTISPGPTYVLNGTPIERDRLIVDLARVYDGRPEKVLFIDADRSVRYQDVFWVFGAVKSAGVTVTAIVPPQVARQ